VAVRGCSAQPHHHHLGHPSGRQVSGSELPVLSSLCASHPLPTSLAGPALHGTPSDTTGSGGNSSQSALPQQGLVGPASDPPATGHPLQQHHHLLDAGAAASRSTASPSLAPAAVYSTVGLTTFSPYPVSSCLNSSSSGSSSTTVLSGPQPQSSACCNISLPVPKRHTSGPLSASFSASAASGAGSSGQTAPSAGPRTAPVLLVTDSSTQTLAPDSTVVAPPAHAPNPFLFPQFHPKRPQPSAASSDKHAGPATTAAAAEMLSLGHYAAMANRLPFPCQTLRRRSADPSELYRSRQSLRLGLARSTSASPSRWNAHTNTRTNRLFFLL
jgi:hypothetical protein